MQIIDRLTTNHLLAGNWQRPFDTQIEPVVLSRDSHNTVQIFQCNCPTFLLVILIGALIHLAEYEMLNSLPKWQQSEICLNMPDSNAPTVHCLTSSSISNLFISSVAVFKFSSSIYNEVVTPQINNGKKKYFRNYW